MNFNAREAPEVVQAWEQATSSGWGKAVLNSANMRKTLQTEYGIKDAADAPLMVQIDAWKKQVDDAIGEAVRAGNGNKARVLGGMRDNVIKALDDANPAYATARNAWSGPSKYIDAVEEGRTILSNKVGAEELTARIGAMTDAEREGYRIGAVSALQARMGSDPAKLVDQTKYLRSPAMRDKIAAIMPTPEAAESWARRLNFEVSASELTGRSLGSSATARRLAEQKDAENIMGDLVMDALTGSPAASLFKRAVMAVPTKVRDTLRSRADARLADLLTQAQDARTLREALDRAAAAHRPGPPSTKFRAIQGTNALDAFLQSQ